MVVTDDATNLFLFVSWGYQLSLSLSSQLFYVCHTKKLLSFYSSNIFDRNIFCRFFAYKKKLVSVNTETKTVGKKDSDNLQLNQYTLSYKKITRDTHKKNFSAPYIQYIENHEHPVLKEFDYNKNHTYT